MTETDVKTAVLHRKIAEHMDTETADALIERLPPDWEQLATKTDLARLGTELRGEMAELRGEMAELRGEMGELRGELRGGMAELRGEMATLGADLGGKIMTLAAAMESMEGRLERRAARDLRTVLFAFAGFALAVMGMFATVLVAGVPAAG
ncbi:MAG: hypothetical protein OXH28_00410 [bacterium]|nr:hypothetical protein [bacterium]